MTQDHIEAAEQSLHLAQRALDNGHPGAAVIRLREAKRHIEAASNTVNQEKAQRLE